ncbi:GspH/FimT family pseudopilin [Aquipseudomonas campi]
MKKPWGHTLAELLIVLSILAIAASTAIPALSQTLEDHKRTAALNQMLGALDYSRSAAVFAHHNTVLCAGASNCNGSPVWSGHLTIFHDLNGNGRRDAYEPVLRQEILPEGYSWHWSSFRRLPHAIFEADGTSQASNGTLTLCKNGQPQKQIIINLVGRIRHQSPATEATCR